MRAPTDDLEEVAARIIAEEPVRASKIGRRLGVSADAVVRWIRRGKMGVRLEGCRLAGKGWCSSWQALARFSAAQTAAAGGGAPAVVAPQQRERRARAAEEQMAALRRRRR